MGGLVIARRLTAGARIAQSGPHEKSLPMESESARICRIDCLSRQPNLQPNGTRGRARWRQLAGRKAKPAPAARKRLEPVH